MDKKYVKKKREIVEKKPKKTYITTICVPGSGIIIKPTIFAQKRV
jgi:hypothetical protein